MLTKATELQPLWPAPYNNLARVYLAQGKTDEAVAKFEDALAANPKNAGAYLALGSIYEQKNDTANAIKVYQRALEVHPSMWAAANNLAFLLGESSDDPKDLERALSLARKANDLRPNEPLVLDTLAWIQYKLGDLPEARQNLINGFGTSAGKSSIQLSHGCDFVEKRELPGGQAADRDRPGKQAEFRRKR